MRTYQKVKLIPHKLLIKKNGMVKIKCDGCNNHIRTRYVVRIKGKFLCKNCKMKLPGSIMINSLAQEKVHYSLEEALNKTYEVRGYLNKANGIQAHLNTPSILIGHKIKFLLVK